MTAAVWNWVPDSALGSLATLGPIDRVAEQWAERWCAGLDLRRQRPAFAAASANRPVVARSPHFSVVAADAGLTALIGRALDMDLPRIELNASDQALVDALKDEMFRDLTQSLEALLDDAPGLDRPSSGDASGALALEFTDEAGRKILAIETSRAVLGGIRRSALPTTVKRAPASLTSISKAVGDTRVTLAATIGSALISLPEVRRLGPGDVIVLDRLLDRPIDLVAQVGGANVACAVLVDAASPRSLRLEPAADLDRR